MKILIVSTSHTQIGDTGRTTGVWLEELALPYVIFTEAGASLTLASVKGGRVPLDPKSESIMVTNSTTRRFQKDPQSSQWLDDSVQVEAQNANDYDMLFIAGGHGTMWDFPHNESLIRLIQDFNSQGKLIGAVCHGVSALLNVKTNTGEAYVKGKRLTAYSNSEEKSTGLVASMPFLLESSLTALGASYSKGVDFENYIVVDGNLITGQNPASSEQVSRKMLVCFKEASEKAELAQTASH